MNLSTHRKNNIYKIYSKLNDSYRRCTIERDGQRYHNTANIENFQNYTFLSIASEQEIEPHIVNKPCYLPILAIYKKKFYGEKWNKFYYIKKCKKINYKIVNTKENIDIYQKRQDRLSKRKSADILKRWKERKKKILQKAKEKKKLDKKKKQIKHLIDFLDYIEKYKAIKNKNWGGTTSRGSKYHFYGIERIDIPKLQFEYRHAIKFVENFKNNRHLAFEKF